ncbi:MAG: hypothetical protein R3C20_17875 [Planctomycetaceae bacterium]
MPDDQPHGSSVKRHSEHPVPYDLIPMAWKVTSGICVGLIVVLYARIWKLSQPD